MTVWGDCDPSTNGFAAASSGTTTYYLGPGGEQLSEFDGTGAWKHTNVYAAGSLIATYDSQGIHYHLEGPLGSRRVQTNASGATEQTFVNLPYGEMPAGQSLGATEQHFTGKERDVESGNDYFGTRYYASSIGRFISPDWSAAPVAVPFASLSDPQSLDLYSYVLNSPLTSTDPDGRWHQVCSGPKTSYSPSGDTIIVSVNENCHEVRDWYDWVGAERWIGDHPKTVHGIFWAVNGLTIASALFDEGASLEAVPEEVAGEDALSEAGEEAVGSEGATVGSRAAPDVTNLCPKIVKQIASRGWTEDEIVETVKNGVAHDGINKATGGSAVEYVNPVNGKFVVIDRSTNQILQISGPEFLPNYLNP